jgi:GNAT superfamily N-acetyltransferase
MHAVEIVERKPTVPEFAHLTHQRRGVGSKIVEALTRFVESVPFKNTWIGVFAVEGTVEFYARYGYKAQAPTGPAMYR